MNAYDKIKSQLSYTTGKQPITCPNCGKDASAKVSQRLHKYGNQQNPFSKMRHVVTTCRHCHASYDFVW